MHWQLELQGHWGSRELMSQHQGKQKLELGAVSDHTQ